jgi:deazaflavin-dependent oxidoreductase (nitroreductase family)
MPNPFAKSRWFHKVANVTGGPQMFRLFPVPRGFALLRARGRRTGKLRDRPIRAIRDGDTLYAVAILGKRSDWLRNARKTPDARVRVGRRWHGARVREVTDPAEREKAKQLYVETMVPYDYFDVPLVEWTLPTPGKIVEKHESWLAGGVLVAIELGARA